MKNKIGIQSYIGREIESKPVTQSKIYAILFLINIVAIGYFGIYRGFVTYSDKKNLESELLVVHENLNNNIEIINDITPYVQNNAGTSFIYSAVPDNIDAARYLEDLTYEASRNGYILQNLHIAEVQSGQVEVNTRFFGPPSRFVDFLQDIEGLDRLTTIKTVSYQAYAKRDKTILVNMKLEIYRTL